MEEDLKKMLQENLELSQDIQKRVKKIQKGLMVDRFLGFLKVLIIVVPIVLGIIYLPSFLEKYYTQYQEMVGGLIQSMPKTK